jgi:teichuronic acid biosynthesis glycosyltransferase TuaG
MSGPCFSVVIPAYNAGLSIAETLSSVLAQSWTDFEVLVIDDGSTDATGDIVRGFEERDPRVRLIASERFGRPAGPRNLGIRRSQGDYIAFLDADDLWRPEKLAHDATHLARDPADFLYSGCDYFVGSPDNIVASLDPAPMSKRILFRNLVMIQTVCVARRLFAAEGLAFDEDPRLRGIEDYHFVLEAYLRGLRMVRRAGSDVLYRKSSPTSIYPRGNLPLLLYRHAWNLHRIRAKYALPTAEYCFFLALTMAYKSAQAALGRA